MVSKLAARHALPNEMVEGVTERTAGVPLRITRAMAHLFTQAAHHYSAIAALRWAQVRGLGGGEALARAEKYAKDNADPKNAPMLAAGGPVAGGLGFGAGGLARGAVLGTPARTSALGSAGVPLYDGASNLANLQDAVNTNKLLDIEGYDGIKTGTTTAAGSCLVGSGRRGCTAVLLPSR